MSLSIAFNGQRLAGQRLGVGRYVEYMLKHWSELLQPDEHVTLFARQPVEDDLSALGPRLTTELLPSRLSGIPWENLRLRTAARSSDVLFCPAYTAPIRFRGRSVVATHSVNETVAGLHSAVYEQTYTRLYQHCARRAERVIVPAEITKVAVAERYRVDVERIVVIPQGVDDVFEPISDGAVLRSVREQFFGSDRPYLLFVGKLSSRRNIPMLIRAFAELKHSRGIPHGLLLFGPNHEGLPLESLCRELGVLGDVVQTDGKIEHHSELVSIYSAADVFVHPSAAEGWSITTVEAMACGVPVVAANRGGLSEVADGYALMIDDLTVTTIAEAIETVLEDDQLRADLRQRSRRRGQQLNWRGITERTLDVVREVGRE